MNHIEDKKITKVTDEVLETVASSKAVSQEQLQSEFDYIQAEKILNNMLDQGLITRDEFNKITVLNRQTFSPFLAEIMP